MNRDRSGQKEKMIEMLSRPNGASTLELREATGSFNVSARLNDMKKDGIVLKDITGAGDKFKRFKIDAAIDFMDWIGG